MANYRELGTLETTFRELGTFRDQVFKKGLQGL